MKTMTEFFAQMHHDDGTMWMWMGHWTGWLVWLVLLGVVVWLLVRFSGRNKK
jgi:hypothetical protein